MPFLVQISMQIHSLFFNFDLNLTHATNRQYLQGPLKPDCSSMNHMAQAADGQLDAVVIFQPVTNLAQRET